MSLQNPIYFMEVIKRNLLGALAEVLSVTVRRASAYANFDVSSYHGCIAALALDASRIPLPLIDNDAEEALDIAALSSPVPSDSDTASKTPCHSTDKGTISSGAVPSLQWPESTVTKLLLLCLPNDPHDAQSHAAFSDVDLLRIKDYIAAGFTVAAVSFQ